MKRMLLLPALCAVLLGVRWSAYRAAMPPEPALSRYVPSGALLYLEARDFASLLSDWEQSDAKKTWLKSKNYEQFCNSHLWLRLKSAGEEFSAAAGVPADANLLQQVAGKQTAFALYDIGKLQFVYVTRASSGFANSALWQTRSKFEPRTAAGLNFYYRKDPDSEREVAFAVSGEYVVLATREDLLGAALEMIARGQGQSVEEDAWWVRAVSNAGAPGELRMVLNLEKIAPSPYFRSYWIPQNITEMKQYSAAISDLTRQGGEYREERTLYRKTAAAPDPAAAKGAAAVADLLRLAPDDSGLYQARANPSLESSLEWLTAKILAPQQGPPAPEKIAPQLQLGNGETGAASDLETRIDSPAAQNRVAVDGQAALKTLLLTGHVLAQLEVQRTDRDPSGVFIRIHSGVALLGESDWDEKEVQSTLTEFLRPAFTEGHLGLEWKDRPGYHVLDGLWPLSLAVRGSYLLVSDDPAILTAMLAGFDKKPDAAPSAFFAAFSHQRERANLVALTKFLDRESGQPGNGAAPAFFSENLASLSFSLQEVTSQKVAVRDSADRRLETVVYAWGR